MSLEAMFMNGIGAIIINGHRQEMILDIGPFKFVGRADKTTGFKLVAGSNTFT